MKREALISDDDVAEAFVRRAVFIRRGRGGGKPAFVDAAAVQAVGVEIVGVELESRSRPRSASNGWSATRSSCARGWPRTRRTGAA